MQFHGLLLVLKPTNRIKVRDHLEGFFLTDMTYYNEVADRVRNTET